MVIKMLLKDSEKNVVSDCYDLGNLLHIMCTTKRGDKHGYKTICFFSTNFYDTNQRTIGFVTM